MLLCVCVCVCVCVCYTFARLWLLSYLDLSVYIRYLLHFCKSIVQICDQERFSPFEPSIYVCYTYKVYYSVLQILRYP